MPTEPTEWIAPPETHQALRELFSELDAVQGRVMNYVRAVGDILRVESGSRFEVSNMTFYAPKPESDATATDP